MQLKRNPFVDAALLIREDIREYTDNRMREIKVEKFTLSRCDDFMEGWPDLIRTQSGKLICIYNECVSHGNRDHTHITLRESLDNGYTWSEKRYIDKETFQGDQWNSIRVNQMRDGTLWLVCDRIDVHERTDTTEIWMWKSTDDGMTWSEGMRRGIYGYCSDKIRELSDGTLLLLVSSHCRELDRSVVYAHRSEDGGETWSGRILAAADTRLNLIEPAVIELPDGRLAAFMRENSAKNYCCMRVVSADKGKTWSEILPFPIPGCHRPAVGYLSDGRMMLSYRSYLDKIERYTAAAVFDTETAASESASEQDVSLIRIDCDNAADPDGGYTAWVTDGQGGVLMANYITDDAPRAYIRGYRFREP